MITDYNTAKEFAGTLEDDQRVELACRWAESGLRNFEAEYPGNTEPHAVIEAARMGDTPDHANAVSNAAAFAVWAVDHGVEWESINRIAQAYRMEIDGVPVEVIDCYRDGDDDARLIAADWKEETGQRRPSGS